MKKILIIAYVFPPIAYAGTHRTLRLCKHLPSLGYDIDVLTIMVQKDLHNDFNLLEGVEDRVNIIRTPMHDPHRYYRHAKAVFGTTLFGRAGTSILSRLVDFLSTPDHMVFWILSAMKPALKMIRETKYDYIYTTSPPHSEHIIGYLLKKRMPECRWVVDMRDPMIDNIIFDQIGLLDRYIYRHMEKLFAIHADAIVFNTAYAAERFSKRYVNGKSHLIRNSYDESSFVSVSDQKQMEQFTIAHVGSIYAFRNVDLLFSAVAKLSKKKLIDPLNFKLLFIGMNDANLLNSIKKFGIERLTEIHGMIPHRRALKIMKCSHLLLLVKGLGKNSASQIPGKLYEYLATGNRILHIGPTNSEARDIIDSENAGRTFSDNVEALMEYIYGLYKSYLKDPHAFRNQNFNPEKYSSRNMANQMHHLFQSL